MLNKGQCFDAVGRHWKWSISFFISLIRQALHMALVKWITHHSIIWGPVLPLWIYVIWVLPRLWSSQRGQLFIVSGALCADCLTPQNSLLWLQHAPCVYTFMAYFRTVNILIETLFCVWSDVVKLQNNLLSLQSLWHKQFEAQKGAHKSCFW